jgi:hypothetical protein
MRIPGKASRLFGIRISPPPKRLLPVCRIQVGKDEAVTLGVMKSGQKYIDSVAKRQSDNGIAMGLTRYLIESDRH